LGCSISKAARSATSVRRRVRLFFASLVDCMGRPCAPMTCVCASSMLDISGGSVVTGGVPTGVDAPGDGAAAFWSSPEPPQAASTAAEINREERAIANRPRRFMKPIPLSG